MNDGIFKITYGGTEINLDTYKIMQVAFNIKILGGKKSFYNLQSNEKLLTYSEDIVNYQNIIEKLLF